MGIRVECDWCGEDIDTDVGWATLKLEGQYTSGRSRIEAESPRHYHAGWGSGDRLACLTRALEMLDGVELEKPSEAFEWQLVPTTESPRYRGTRIVLGTTPLSVLGLKASTRRTLENGGVLTAEHAADIRQRGDTPRGLGPARPLELDKALLEHGFLGELADSEAVA